MQGPHLGAVKHPEQSFATRLVDIVQGRHSASLKIEGSDLDFHGILLVILCYPLHLPLKAADDINKLCDFRIH